MTLGPPGEAGHEISGGLRSGGELAQDLGGQLVAGREKGTAERSDRPTNRGEIDVVEGDDAEGDQLEGAGRSEELHRRGALRSQDRPKGPPTSYRLVRASVCVPLNTCACLGAGSGKRRPGTFELLPPPTCGN